MAKVNTVLGPMNTEDLGFTLMHEHLLCAFPNAYREYPDILVPNVLEYVVTRLKQAKAEGVDTVVDMTTLDLGRDILFIREAAKQSGVNIIACTGWWLDVPRFVSGIMGSVTAAQMAESFVREIDKGIGDTGIKPGVLKSASDVGGVTPPQEIALRAVAKAHLKTGVPIVIHSYHPGQVAKQQLDILKDEGRQPEICQGRPLQRHHRYRIPDLDFRAGVHHGFGPLSGPPGQPPGPYQNLKGPDGGRL